MPDRSDLAPVLEAAAILAGPRAPRPTSCQTLPTSGPRRDGRWWVRPADLADPELRGRVLGALAPDQGSARRPSTRLAVWTLGWHLCGASILAAALIGPLRDLASPGSPLPDAERAALATVVPPEGLQAGIVLGPTSHAVRLRRTTGRNGRPHIECDAVLFAEDAQVRGAGATPIVEDVRRVLAPCAGRSTAGHAGAAVAAAATRIIAVQLARVGAAADSPDGSTARSLVRHLATELAGGTPDQVSIDLWRDPATATALPLVQPRTCCSRSCTMCPVDDGRTEERAAALDDFIGRTGKRYRDVPALDGTVRDGEATAFRTPALDLGRPGATDGGLPPLALGSLRSSGRTAGPPRS